MGGLGLAGLKFYDPNSTRPTLNFFFVTQPNPPNPKNLLNLAGWVESGRLWWVGRLLHTPMSKSEFSLTWKITITQIFIYKAKRGKN